MRQKTITLYRYDELPTERAKERALAWMEEGVLDYRWWEFTYDDAELIGIKIHEFDLDRHSIEVELLASCGKIVRRILAQHGPQCGTHKLALDWFRSKHGLRSGWFRDGLGRDADGFRKAIGEEYLCLLQSEYDHQTSRECLEENIRANEYEFDEEGELA
jgi:hypothetical protein